MVVLQQESKVEPRYSVALCWTAYIFFIIITVIIIILYMQEELGYNVGFLRLLMLPRLAQTEEMERNGH